MQPAACRRISHDVHRSVGDTVPSVKAEFLPGGFVFQRPAIDGSADDEIRAAPVHEPPEAGIMASPRPAGVTIMGYYCVFQGDRRGCCSITAYGAGKTRAALQLAE